jgi:hypothetical protein
VLDNDPHPTALAAQDAALWMASMEARLESNEGMLEAMDHRRALTARTRAAALLLAGASVIGSQVLDDAHWLVWYGVGIIVMMFALALAEADLRGGPPGVPVASRNDRG